MAKALKNQQKIKDEQINFLLGNLENSLEQYKDSIQNKDKQLAEAKGIIVSAKQSFDKISQENKELKAYIVQINKQFQQQQQHQQLSSRSKPKKYKKVILEEERENETEIESEQESDVENETIKETEQIKKPRKTKTVANVFDYINNQNAKRHKQ